jgi:hypothetical protein
MVNNKIKISELAKDFNMQGKDVCAALSAMGMNYKPSQSVSTQEVGMLFDYLTQKNQVNSLDDVRATAVQAAEQRKQNSRNKEGIAEDHHDRFRSKAFHFKQTFHIHHPKGYERADHGTDSILQQFLFHFALLLRVFSVSFFLVYRFFAAVLSRGKLYEA